MKCHSSKNMTQKEKNGKVDFSKKFGKLSIFHNSKEKYIDVFIATTTRDYTQNIHEISQTHENGFVVLFFLLRIRFLKIGIECT